MQQLTEWIPRGMSEHAPPVERMKTAIAAVQHRIGSVSTGVTGAMARVEGALAGLWDAYKRPPLWTDWHDAVGQWQGGIQFTSWELAKFAHAIKRAIPDRLRREALTNWVQAGGDEALLRDWAAKAAPKYKRGYEVALELTEDEKTFARNVRGYLDAQLEEAQRAGMLEHGLENYLSNIWERNAALKQMQAILGASELQPKPFFTRQRIMRDYFEGEQVGLSPKNKDIGFVLATYHAAFGKAVADRGFIKQLLKALASDGRPLVAVSGVGRTLAEDEAGAAVRAHLILPREKGPKVQDFLTVDSPVLRRWKWVGADEAGKPIYLEGDLVVHPEAFQDLKNLLGRSELRQSTIGGRLLRASAEFKSTLLSLSGFHQVQVAVHALEHRINPFTAPKLDLNDPLQRALVDHGLQVADFSAMEQFSEGLHATGLINKIPLLGKFGQRYSEYLFRDYIPRLKMSMAQAALERNFERYGSKLSRDQILRLTAEQANAAFGELNYKMLSRNKSFQDTMRLMMLAPDFTEARARFVAQALRPYGAEQRTALILGAVVGYTAARIANQLLNGDPLWQPSMAFSVKVGKRAFGLRMVQADTLHLITNPRSFVFNRVNPLIARPLIEAVIGRDQYGRKRDVSEQLRDIVFAGVPIPFQGLTRPQDFDTTESVLKATGVTGYRYRTPAEKTAREQVNAGPTFESTRTPAEQKLMTKHRNAIEAGKFNPVAVRQDVRAGRLTERDEKTLQSEARNPRLVCDVSRLPLEKALDVWDQANAQERKLLRPVLQRKEKQLENRSPAERKALETRLRKAVGQRSERSEPPPLPYSGGR